MCTRRAQAASADCAAANPLSSTRNPVEHTRPLLRAMHVMHKNNAWVLVHVQVTGRTNCIKNGKAGSSRLTISTTPVGCTSGLGCHLLSSDEGGDVGVQSGVVHGLKWHGTVRRHHRCRRPGREPRWGTGRCTRHIHLFNVLLCLRQGRHEVIFKPESSSQAGNIEVKSVDVWTCSFAARFSRGTS